LIVELPRISCPTRLQHSLSEQQRGRRVPRVVHPRVRDLNPGEQRLPVSPIPPWVDWTTGDLREHQAVLVPQRSGMLALRGLDRLMLA